MANGKNSQVQFRFQRPADTIYRVGAGFVFSTVQSAIDQAVTDGASSSNPATVEIYPGTYTENVVLKPGVNLQGVGNGISIVGNCTYPVSNGLTRSQNTIVVTGVQLTVLNGITLAITGTAPVQLTLNQVQVIKQTGGDAVVAYSLSNTGSGSRVRFNAASFIDYNVATGTAMNCERGTTEFRQRNTSVFSSDGVTLGAVAALTNSAQLRVWGCDQWFNGSATNIIDIQSTTAIFDILHSVFANTLSGGNGVLFTAAGTARVRWCFIQMNTTLTGYVAKGAAGTFVYGNVVFIGANRQVQNTLTATADQTTPNLVA